MPSPWIVDRRTFLSQTSGAVGASLFGRLPLEATAGQATTPVTDDWDRGSVRHLLPSVSDSTMLLKVSFEEAVSSTPRLRLGSTTLDGHMNDTAGEHWQFYVTELEPDRSYRLALVSSEGRSLCEPWDLRTFPSITSQPERLRILFFTCAGGVSGSYDGIGVRQGFLPANIRNRLLRRALSFRPDAAVANGDHMYWDLHQWRGDDDGALSRNGELSNFDFSSLVLGTNNETALKAAAGPQIVPVYGVDFRSTPVFFIQDDHDHWENDAASDKIVNFPIPWFQLQLARTTQQLYYPEFLSDSQRPMGLPWSTSTVRGDLSESFGTLRYGRLAEVLLYDVRRTLSLAGPTAVFVDAQVERWLLDRTRSSDVTHVVHAPSNPLGWTAGKWGEWYPDVLNAERTGLTTAVAKPYWQEGWLRQHDRLAAALTEQRERAPLVISGDLHAIGLGRMQRSGGVDMSANPMTTVLSGPVGTAPRSWPSGSRGIGATPSEHIDLEELAAPVEQHGFTLVDFFSDHMEVQLFKWDVNSEPVEALDRLEPFYTTDVTPSA